MAEFQAFEPDIEVNGATILSVVKGAAVFENTARKFLADNGLSNVEDSPDTWYPQQAWLDTFRALKTVVGNRTVYLIGKRIPESASFPPSIHTIEDALASIDIAYHMNHRRKGQVMFNPETGQMLEGIGHYTLKLEGPGQATVVCDNPYPCEFDRGIVTAMAERFQSLAEVTHAEGDCREKHGQCCAYRVTWKA